MKVIKTNNLFINLEEVAFVEMIKIPSCGTNLKIHFKNGSTATTDKMTEEKAKNLLQYIYDEMWIVRE